MTRIEKICCDGYHQNNGLCEPICEQNCPNGKCLEPGKCVCNDGYLLNATTNICQPVCSTSCGFGDCVKPETCRCFEGYQYAKKSKTCEPVCLKKCLEFSSCIKPNLCECNMGYKASNESLSIVQPICEPICQSGCSNGKCVAPDRCNCHNGFSMNSTSQQCQANICKMECPLNAYCYNDGICVCNDGYTKSMFTKLSIMYCEERLVHSAKLLGIFMACILLFALVIVIIVKIIARKKSYKPKEIEDLHKIKTEKMAKDNNKSIKHTAM